MSYPLRSQDSGYSYGHSHYHDSYQQVGSGQQQDFGVARPAREEHYTSQQHDRGRDHYAVQPHYTFQHSASSTYTSNRQDTSSSVSSRYLSSSRIHYSDGPARPFEDNIIRYQHQSPEPFYDGPRVPYPDDDQLSSISQAGDARVSFTNYGSREREPIAGGRFQSLEHSSRAPQAPRPRDRRSHQERMCDRINEFDRDFNEHSRGKSIQ